MASGRLAVTAGLGVTVRPETCLLGNILILDFSVIVLPALPMLGLTLHRTEAKMDTVAQRLWDIILDTLQ